MNYELNTHDIIQVCKTVLKRGIKLTMEQSPQMETFQEIIKKYKQHYQDL